ncbi:MAG: gliding motility-associated C-terminal domain-containing protein [Sphingobacteriales bacterium]|nr:MAG: gliding motility-associated C-terminal domain-containing protein [Sphingobacteriales bacterium]
MRKITLPIILIFGILFLFANSTITLSPATQTICSTGNDSVSFNVNTTAIPNNSQIVFYKNSDSTFNPYSNQGDSIGVININNSSSTNFLANSCPTILGIFIDACNEPPLREQDHEYMIISSGNGFRVSNLGVDLPNSSGTGNGDINLGSCSFATTFRQTYLDSLRTGFCNPSNLIFAGANDSIPGGAIVVVLTGNGTSFPYNFSSFCQLGVPVYIIQNSCFRSSGAFVNNAVANSCNANATASEKYRLTRIVNRGCSDTLIYDRCGLLVYTPANENDGDGNYVIRQKNGSDTASVANGGIQNNASNRCNGVVADSLIQTYKFTYKIPASVCNDTTYIKAVVKPTTTTGQVISNNVNFYYSCVDVSTNSNSRINICSGEQTDISITSTDPNATFTWTTANGTNTSGEAAGSGDLINQTLTLSGNATLDSVTYDITATDKGCTKTIQVKVIITKAPTKPNLGLDTSVCGTFSKVLSAGQAANWTRNGSNVGTNVPTFTATQVGTYIATVTNTCGTVSDTLVITSNNLPTKPNLGNDTSVCGTFSKVLNAGQNATWTLNGNNVGTDVSTISATQIGTYIASVTNTCGTVSDTIIITQKIVPTVDLRADTTICNGATITLDATNSGATYEWNTGAETATINVSTEGTYSVVVTLDGCTATDSKFIDVLDAPSAFNLGNDTAYCGAFSRVLTISTGESATWSTTETGTSITITEAGTYSATVSNQCGEQQSRVTISQKTVPTVDLRADTTICNGASITLDATYPDATYEWNTEAETATIDVSTEGTYSVVVTLDGCTATDSRFIDVLDAPSAFTLGDDTTYCGVFSRVLTTSTGESATWSTGQTGTSITVTEAGTYTATVSNQCGQEQSNVTITQNQLPTVSLGKDTALCTEPIILSIGETEYASVVWSTLETSNSITIEEDGVYFVKVTDGNGCSNTDSINVGINCKNEIWVPNAFTPNGDGMNDIFYVRGNAKNVRIDLLVIYDRWGNKLFETGNIVPDNKTLGWDGTYKGKKQQVEAYGYYIKVSYLNGEKQEIKGNVTLME